MKKTISILGMGLLLVGCSSAATVTTLDSSVTDGDAVVASGDGFQVTKNDIYQKAMDGYGASVVYRSAITAICDKELTDTDAIDAKVKETLEQYASYMPDGIDAYAQGLGFENGDDYIENAIKPGVKQTLLQEKYVTDNYDNLVKEEKVHYLKTITYATEEEADAAIKSIKSAEDFETKMTEIDTGKDVGIVTKDATTADANILALLDEFTKDGMYSKPIATSDSKYAIVLVYNTDLEPLKEDVQKHLATVANVQTACDVHYLTTYGFEVNELQIRQQIENMNEDYLG